MALSEIEKLERRYAENPQGLTFAPLAEVHRKNGDVTRALELLRPGLGLHPDYIPASIVLGRCHLDLGELPAAETAFTHVLALDGENVIALKALADITERQGRFDEAERWLRTLLAIDRSNDDARDQLGRVEATRRQTAGAAVAPEALAPAAEGVPAEAAATESSNIEAEARTVEASPAAEPAVSAERAPEHVMGWVADSDSAEAVEAVPLDLEDLDRVGEVEAAPPEGIQLEQPVALEDTVEPIAGLVGRDDVPDVGSFDQVTDFRVETAEDIVLNSSGGGEFQVANAAEELLGMDDAFEPRADASAQLEDAPPPLSRERESPPPEAAAFEPPSAEPPTPEFPAEGGMPAATARTGDEPIETAAPPAAEPARAEEITAEAPVPEWARPIEPETEPVSRAVEPAGSDWTPPWSRPREPELATSEPEPPAPEPVPVAASATWSPPAAEPPRAAEADVVVTASMAELLLQQGHPVEALTVYRLLETRGGEPRYRDKIAELERMTAPPEPPPAPPPPPPAPSPAYSVLVTKGQSSQAFLRGILGARPPASTGASAAHASSSRSATADTGGAPTRPAHDTLSLSSVFGEESGPTQPAVPAAGAGGPAAGVSYDEFFSGAASAPAPRPARAPDPKNDDLDQFHAWLQNLKR